MQNKYSKVSYLRASQRQGRKVIVLSSPLLACFDSLTVVGDVLLCKSVTFVKDTSLSNHSKRRAKNILPMFYVKRHIAYVILKWWSCCKF